MYVYPPSRRTGIRNEPPNNKKSAGTSDDLFIPTTLRSLQKQDLLLHDGVVLEHAERTVRTGTDHRAIETGHGHGDEAHGDGARLDCMVRLLSVTIHQWLWIWIWISGRLRVQSSFVGGCRRVRVMGGGLTHLSWPF